ncbi:hypothetical protein [Nocardia brasiliensis]|uniref:hypothetical protein n=1 Tax=Nocardia brasiliensis TaxID=37326 RepID=UPI00245677FA|nr:hypothetical protein [Nocardia brasiliensis]
MKKRQLVIVTRMDRGLLDHAGKGLFDALVMHQRMGPVTVLLRRLALHQIVLDQGGYHAAESVLPRYTNPATVLADSRRLGVGYVTDCSVAELIAALPDDDRRTDRAQILRSCVDELDDASAAELVRTTDLVYYQ